jgi:hypothetical protein
MYSKWLRSITGRDRHMAQRSWLKGVRKRRRLDLELLESRDCPSLSVGNNQDIGNQTNSTFDPSIATDPANSNHEFAVFQNDPNTNPGGYTYVSVGTTVQASTTWSTRQFAQGEDGGDGLPGGAMEAHAAFDANGYLYVAYLAGNVVYSDKLTGATATTMQDTKANWFTNERAGLRLTAGTQTVTIQSNTPNTLTLSSSWNPPSSGSSYAIYWGVGIPSVVLAESSDQGATFRWVAYLDHSASLEGNRPNPRPTPLQAVQTIATGPGNQTGMQSVWILWEERNQSGASNALYVAGANVTSQGVVQTFTTKTSIFSEPQASPLYGVGSLAVGPNGKVAASYEVDGSPPYLGVKVDTGGVSGSFVSEQSVTLPSNFNFPYYIKPQIVDGVSANATLAWDYSGGANNGTLYLVDLEQSTIYARYSTNNGSSWSATTQVSDQNISGDRFLPSASLDESSGNLAVTWYDARNDSSDISAQLFGSVGSLTNGALSFATNVQISGNDTSGKGFSSGWSSDSPPIRFSTGSNTTTTLNDTTQAWQSNSFYGVTITIVWGTGKGEGTSIQSNTATQLVVSPAWGTIPDTTSAYVLGGNQYEFGAFIGVSFVNDTFYTAWADNSGYAGGGPLDIYTSAVTYSGSLLRDKLGTNPHMPLPLRDEFTSGTLPTLRFLETSASATAQSTTVFLSASKPFPKASASKDSIADQFFAPANVWEQDITILEKESLLLLVRANHNGFDKLDRHLMDLLTQWEWAP